MTGKRKHRATLGLTEEESFEMGVTILEVPDPAECAEIILRRWPHASQAEIEKELKACQRELRQMNLGANDDLGPLRRELARINPQWAERG